MKPYITPEGYNCILINEFGEQGTFVSAAKNGQFIACTLLFRDQVILWDFLAETAPKIALEYLNFIDTK